MPGTGPLTSSAGVNRKNTIATCPATEIGTGNETAWTIAVATDTTVIAIDPGTATGTVTDGTARATVRATVTGQAMTVGTRDGEAGRGPAAVSATEIGPETGTGTATETDPETTGTGSATGTDPETGTETGTELETGTETGNATATETDPETETEIWKGTGTGTPPTAAAVGSGASRLGETGTAIATMGEGGTTAGDGAEVAVRSRHSQIQPSLPWLGMRR